MFQRLVAGFLALALVACSAPVGLAPGLVARMDAPGASLDRDVALSMLNHFRTSRGAPILVADPDLDARAEALAARYAANSAAPKPPTDVTAMMTSAGYATFAETFSGWRATEKDAATLADTRAVNAGLAFAYDANSTYGVYWVLLLVPGA